MCTKSSTLMWILLGLVSFCDVAISQDINITIPLNKTLTFLDKQLYETFVNLNSSAVLQVNFSDLKKYNNIAFLIFQVHSHIYNVTLYKNVNEKGSSVYGTDVGLYSGIGKKFDIFFVRNDNVINLKLYVSVMGYMKQDPIPGGCNMEFPVDISPFMVTTHNKDFITVDFAPAQKDINCLEINFIQHTFYMLYLTEQGLGPDEYFEAIRKMTTYSYIEENGRIVPEGSWQNRRVISAYPGTGAIYVVVARLSTKNPFHYSVYVPTKNYGCSIEVEGDCELLEDTLTQLLCACLLFVGLFICYFGHRFFKTQTFFIGFLSGVVSTYIIISLIVTLDSAALILASAISGICIGAIRVIYWWLYGLPVFSIILSSANIGFLAASILYYAIPPNLPYIRVLLQIDYNFWPFFFLISILITLVLLSISFMANLLCCAIIGASAAIYPIDVYLGSNLKYILINIIRRATVKEFRKADLMPPFQWKDIFLALLWLGLSISGFLYQYYQNLGRPPFPPPPRSVRAVPEEPASISGPSGFGYRSLNNAIVASRSETNERTPLLA